jgi:hypothetical protein
MLLVATACCSIQITLKHDVLQHVYMAHVHQLNHSPVHHVCLHRGAIKCYEAGSVNLPYDSVPAELCSPPTDAVLQFEHKYGSQPLVHPGTRPGTQSESRPGTSATTASTGSCGSSDTHADSSNNGSGSRGSSGSTASRSYKRRALQLRQWSLLVTDETLKSVTAQQAARHQAVANAQANAQVSTYGILQFYGICIHAAVVLAAACSNCQSFS